MRILVWHWGRRGAGPIFAVQLSSALSTITGAKTFLSLAASAEILRQPGAAGCDWAEPTYESAAGYVAQRLAGPFVRNRTISRLQTIKPDIAICAMPALLDQRMIQALVKTGIPYAVVVHDATAHPGEELNFRMLDQPWLLRNAFALFPLTAHVEADLWRQEFGLEGQMIAKLWHPPLYFGDMKPPFEHGGRPRILCFGRLLPYKGLDILADALTALGPGLPFDIRVCGDGPVSRDLDRLRVLPHVEVDHRWIPEVELRGLIEWADAVVLPYREASQSGVAAAAVAHGRRVLATNVGGLPEQLAGVPGVIICEPNAAAIAESLNKLTQASVSFVAGNAKASWQSMAVKMFETFDRYSASRLVGPKVRLVGDNG
jgi:glycosyltransferase involved in cell wall biosynthesis